MVSLCVVYCAKPLQTLSHCLQFGECLQFSLETTCHRQLTLTNSSAVLLNFIENQLRQATDFNS